jgi:hypothetical protein
MAVPANVALIRRVNTLGRNGSRPAPPRATGSAFGPVQD